MVSYYPRRVRAFPTHRNLLDDVDATHINAIQAELSAVMRSLGTSPQVYNNIETDTMPVGALPNDEGGVIDDDTQFTSVYRYYDPKIKPVDHGTVGARLDNIERGLQFHVFRMGASNLSVGTSSTSLSTRPKGVRMIKPSGNADPYKMFNGVGATLRKSGFWIFSGSVIWTLTGTTAGSNDGVYQATIDYDGKFLEGMERGMETGVDKAPILNPLLMGYFTAGAQVSLRVSQSSGRTQKIRNARLAGILLREAV